MNPKDPAAMSAAVLHLVENPGERQALAEKAYALGRQMGWGNVSKQYLKTFADVMELAGKESPVQQERVSALLASV